MLYVGKAKSLHNRLQSYRRIEYLTPRIRQMVETAQFLKFQILESELEALLVEAELIRLHQPPTNILLKDDKSPLYILITDEPFPRVLTCRKKEIDRQDLRKKGTLLGPFPSGYKVREVLKIARQIFPWCNAPRPTPAFDPEAPTTTTETTTKPTNPALKTKACFYFHLGQCPGVCVGAVSIGEYRHTIQQLVLFLRGKKKDVLKQLKEDMLTASNTEEYELAQNIKTKIELIASVTQRTHQLRPDLTLPTLQLNQAEERMNYLREMLSRYISLPKQYPFERIEGYDVSNISGTLASVSMVVATKGLIDTSQYRLFNITSLYTPNDYAMHQEALQRRQRHPEWGEPQLIVIDGGKGQLRAALKVWDWACPVVALAKDPDRLIIPGPGLTESSAKGLVRYHEIKLDQKNPGHQLLLQLRDESHRFSKKQHTRRRTKQLLSLQ